MKLIFLKEEHHILELMRFHRTFDLFDYSIAIDWAREQISLERDTENIRMLASFSEPIDRWQIKPYVTSVLSELGLEEYEHENPVHGKTHYHLVEILNNNSIRKNLYDLSQLCMEYQLYESELMNFYLLYHAWGQLEEMGENFYFAGANLRNIENFVKAEARNWIQLNINKNVDVPEVQENEILVEKEQVQKEDVPLKAGALSKLKSWFGR